MGEFFEEVIFDNNGAATSFNNTKTNMSLFSVNDEVIKKSNGIYSGCENNFDCSVDITHNPDQTIANYYKEVYNN